MLKFEDLDLSDRYNLIKSLPKHYMNGVEIGVWEGWYTQHLIAGTNMHIFGIDPFCETDSYDSPCVWDIEKHKADFDPFKFLPSGDGYAYPETRYMTTVRSLNQMCQRYNRFTILRAYSYDAKYFFIGSPLDFVYIDGEHTYKAVLQDMNDYWDKIKVGGIMAGHDYNDTNPGSVKAVNEFAEKNKLEFRITGTSPEKGDANAPSWVFIKGEE